LDMGDPVHIVDLAADMIRLSGLEVGKDINIEMVGLRPGEKIFEELYLSGEQCLSTSHSKIIVANCRQAQPVELVHLIASLERLAQTDPNNIFAQLRKIVPEYDMPTPLQAHEAVLKFPQERRAAA
jgi:FlaA1/EpsC-like NDP-sugar epimerase